MIYTGTKTLAAKGDEIIVYKKEHNDRLFGTGWLKSLHPAKPNITSLENCNCAAASSSEAPSNDSFCSDGRHATTYGYQSSQDISSQACSSIMTIAQPSQALVSSGTPHRRALDIGVFCHLSTDGTLIRCGWGLGWGGGWEGGLSFLCLRGGRG